MKKDLNQMRYEYALRRVEELLPLVDDSKPASAPEAIELAIMSDFVIAYEKEHYPIGKPTLRIAKALCAVLGISPVLMLGM